MFQLVNEVVVITGIRFVVAAQCRRNETKRNVLPRDQDVARPVVLPRLISRTKYIEKLAICLNSLIQGLSERQGSVVRALAEVVESAFCKWSKT